MTAHVKVGSVYKPLSMIHGHQGGAIRRLNKGWAKVGGVWRQVWQDEVVVTLGSGSASSLIAPLFTAGDWANPLLRKRVVIAPGAERGANAQWGAIAIQDGSLNQSVSWAGELVIDNYGTISGIGGAPNSGEGGWAFLANFPSRTGAKATVNNYGTIRAGGGGGGRAGNGGAGVWYSGRTVTEGPFYGTSPWYVWHFLDGSNFIQVYWAGATVYSMQGPSGTTSVSAGGYTYHRGDYVGYDGGYLYRVSRSYTVYDVPNYTSGGIAPNAGRGQGFDGAATVGGSPVAGGTNAGASGKSGDGGAWGQPGQTGGNGAAGNVGAGLAGAAGGLAGFYLNGAANVTLNNYGTLLGRVA